MSGGVADPRRGVAGRRGSRSFPVGSPLLAAWPAEPCARPLGELVEPWPLPGPSRDGNLQAFVEILLPVRVEELRQHHDLPEPLTPVRVRDPEVRLGQPG